MGDQIGVALEGEMYFVGKDQFECILDSDINQNKKVELFASLARINTLYMIAKAGSGHIGSSFSSMEIISYIYINEIFLSKDKHTSNIFFSSKGHDAPGIYSALIGLQKLDFDLLHKLRRINGLPGHPDISTKNIITNTGSLGMGISKAKGMILANRQKNRKSFIYVLTGDGELQEGQFWESLVSAVNNNLEELIVIIDHNKLQSDTLLEKVSSLGDLESKLRSFHWNVYRCNGNNVNELSEVLTKAKKPSGKPNIIIADTIKGRGVSFMEHTSIDSDTEFYKFHSGAPSANLYREAVQELVDSADKLFSQNNLPPLLIESINQPSLNKHNENIQNLISSYSSSLVHSAQNNENIVALDADLMIDTGLLQFSNEFPNRFFECGIAEQDMVSQAGGLALKGYLPIVHSFSCFLSARANEQIYNNSTEQTKIIYVGSLSGILPAGPGHSHQSLRDISLFGSVPNMTILEPSTEFEVEQALSWAINENNQSTYIRLVSVPWPVSFDASKKQAMTIGQGTRLTEGDSLTIIAYGPIMLSLAYDVSEYAKENYSLPIKVLNLPWLNNIDASWLCEEIKTSDFVLSLDNHYSDGGQGGRISSILYENGMKIKFKNHAIDTMPACGTNEEVLEHHGFTVKKLFKFFQDFLEI
jgi:transketolase